MPTTTFDTPGPVLARLQELENDLAARQPALESAALGWYRKKRDKERKWAIEFIAATGTVADRKAIADRETAMMGVAEECEYEALRAVIRVMETRSNIGMAILKSHGRA
jgi:hypothetical protein